MRTNRIGKFISTETGLSVSIMLLIGLGLIEPARCLPIFDSGSTGADGALVYHTPPDVVMTYDPRMAYDLARQRTVLFGSDSTDTPATWEWDGTSWQRKNTLNSPPFRYGFDMAYDASREVIVLFGGRNLNGILHMTDLTWEYDGSNWTSPAPATEPEPRDFHRMVYDASLERILLVGGRLENNSVPGDTWTWDGINWEEITTVVSPQRVDFGLAYDTNRQRAVLFGGASDGTFPAKLDDTFEWNGTDWTLIASSNSPSPRWAVSMAYDSARQETVLFGGSDGNGGSDETWVWNGTIWTKRLVTGPSARVANPMAFDAGRGRTVLFGGKTPGPGTIDDTWEWDGTNWILRIDSEPLRIFDMSSRESGIWNFTTINIPSGVTVQFNKNTSNTPVIWLATGEVNIAGEINLDGEDGVASVAPGNEAQGGPGGFAGGLGHHSPDGMTSAEGTPGLGPGGGLPTIVGDAGHGSFSTKGTGSGAVRAGPTYGDFQLIPLIGGSGGAGGYSSGTNDGRTGGGGGGAILIASSESITLGGSIHANGGLAGFFNDSGNAGNGSGGGIRLAAPSINGSGGLSAVGAYDVRIGQGGAGRIRLDGFDVSPSITSVPPASFGPPISTGLQDQATIVITNIAGVGVPANPTGNLASPDVIFTETGSVTVDLQTTNIPVGTDLTVRITASGQELLQSATVGSGGSAQAVFPMVPAGVGTVQAYAEFAAP